MSLESAHRHFCRETTAQGTDTLLFQQGSPMTSTAEASFMPVKRNKAIRGSTTNRWWSAKRLDLPPCSQMTYVMIQSESQPLRTRIPSTLATRPRLHGLRETAAEPMCWVAETRSSCADLHRVSYCLSTTLPTIEPSLVRCLSFPVYY